MKDEIWEVKDKQEVVTGEAIQIELDNLRDYIGQVRDDIDETIYHLDDIEDTIESIEKMLENEEEETTGY
tara:strand:+ start:4800 stop:5009 length:210 start_codon:yes stop_codon:yes gene_type:complete